MIEQRITVDACIADDIVRLNKRGVYTVGSCCGHGVPCDAEAAAMRTSLAPRASAVILPSCVKRARSLGYEVQERVDGYPIVFLHSKSASR